MLQCDCVDFEAMHKWAMKQFMRIVPHGRKLGQHLSNKHYAQLLCTVPQPEEPAPLLFCHCGGDPCTHSMHVHAEMPGLREDGYGHYGPVRRSHRYTQELVVADMPHKHQTAIRRFIGELTGQHYLLVPLPEVVTQAQTMQLSWHNQEGVLQVCPSSGI